jgi:glycosyltransferase involved in cell wall biosynthesis
VVANVVDTSRFRFRRREPIRPVLISSRLLEKLYAVENTIRAFALIRARIPESELLVIGGGDQEPMLRKLVEAEGIEGVTFVGAVPHDGVGDWFDRADIFVNSSREDNMPHSIIEAFSSGLPVVTTRAGGIPYIVEHSRNGLLVDIDRPEQLAAAVLTVLSDTELSRKMIEAGRVDCATRYSWEAAQQQWRQVYRRLGGDARARVHTVVEAAS